MLARARNTVPQQVGGEECRVARSVRAGATRSASGEPFTRNTSGSAVAPIRRRVQRVYRVFLLRGNRLIDVAVGTPLQGEERASTLVPLFARLPGAVDAAECKARAEPLLSWPL